jgi:hypothetical protein
MSLPGCAHWQQVIWELFNAMLKGSKEAEEGDTEFLHRESAALSALKSVRPTLLSP